MSAVPPNPATEDNPLAPWTAAFDSMLQLQQRWWAQWSEGVQLWTSWWLTPMPPITGAEWTQPAEQAVRTATEAAQTVADQAGDVAQASPLPMNQGQNRPRGQARPH